MHDEMEADEDVIAYGEDVGKDGGVFRATKELQNEFGKTDVSQVRLQNQVLLELLLV